MKNINKQCVLFLVMLASFNYSCKKFLEVDPPKDAATTSQIFENDAMATSAVTGIYSRMANIGAFSGTANSISVLAGLSADELKSHSVSLDVFFKNEIPATNSTIDTYLWTEFYTYIYTANAILEGLNSPNNVSESTVKQIRGEAKFIRAFCYFYLQNLFGNVPLNLSTDYKINNTAGKSSKEQIYNQIINDLTDAETLLTEDYVTIERIRPNKFTATALLSRVYLYNEKWDLAAQKATDVINHKPTYVLMDDLDKVFLKNSTESIWQLMPTAGGNTKEGALFILTATPTSVSLSPDLLPLFVPNDKRKTNWIKEFSNTTGKYYYPYKYKIKSSAIVTEYSTVIRLAEMYLIRGEARARLLQAELSLEDINLIIKRAGITIPLVGLNSSQCLAEIEKQRRLEFFTEWGHRWFDLKRTGRASEVLAPLKGATWKDTDQLYPIPNNEVIRNINNGQNLGY